MSAFIGSVRGPHHNSPYDKVEVWCSKDGAEMHTLGPGTYGEIRIQTNLDPIAARNLAALLVRASEETERMRARTSEEEAKAASKEPR